MSLNQLWAPWRMEFIKGGAPKGCVFCTLPAQGSERDRDNLIVQRGEHAFTILNKFPYNNGHLMVVPHEHTADYLAVNAAVHAEMHTLAQNAMRALNSLYQPHGYNVGMNLGGAAGAGIRDHLHLHIVPRWNGDTNFMPVLAEVRCLPQHLMTSYDQIRAAVNAQGVKT